MNFEKLECWQRSSKLCADIYIETSKLRDFGFRDQLTRSALSVPSNIAEGMSRFSDKEKRRFLEIARASVAELLTQIYIGIEIKYLDPSIGEFWISETKELSAMISGLINTIGKK